VSARLAVAGYGWMAERHAECFRALGAGLAAAANRSPEGRRRAHDEGRFPRVYASAPEMVETERPDGVLVAASVLSQFELTRALIPLGVPLLVEKPPGTSAAEARELADLAAAHGTPVMVALNRRFHSVLQRALASAGGPQAVTRVDVDWSEDPEGMARAGHPAEVIPRLVFANSLHGLDLLTWLAGPLVAPRATGEDLDRAGPWPRWRMTVEGTGRTGVAAAFRSTWAARVPWRLAFETAEARVVSAPLETAVVHRPRRVPEVLEPDDDDRRFKPGLMGQARAFLDVVRGGPLVWPACSLEESCASMDLAEALTRACRAAGGA
jgi:predicted dehydrogenase